MSWFILGIFVVCAMACGLLMTGQLGDLPALPDDRPVPRLPAGDFDDASLRDLRFGTVPRGYAKDQVNGLLGTARAHLQASHEVDGRAFAQELRNSQFTVRSGGYQMHQVDVVIARLARQFDALAVRDQTPPPTVGSPVDDPTDAHAPYRPLSVEKRSVDHVLGEKSGADASHGE